MEVVSKRNERHQNSGSMQKHSGKRNSSIDRRIPLLNAAGKVFARVVLPRIQTLAERLVFESHCFRCNRSSADIIFSLRHIEEKFREQLCLLHIDVVGFTKAFHIVRRARLYIVLQKIACPLSLLCLDRSLHDHGNTHDI